MAFDTLDFDALRAKPEISALDLVRMRDALAHEGPLTEDEACALLEIELSAAPKALGWKAFFIDALMAFAIHDVQPDGYLTADKADWLLRCAAPQGRILSGAVFELLTAVLAAARWVPQRLVSALFDEIYCSVATGDGPLRSGASVPPGVITQRDAAVVRHLLYAGGKSDVRSITRAEAAGLIAIDLAGHTSSVHPMWSELFAKAIVDAAFSASLMSGPARETFLQMGPATADVLRMADHIGQATASYRRQTAEDIAIAALERQRIAIVTGDEIEPCTAEWLSAVLSRSRSGSAAQALLYAVLHTHAAILDPQLRALLEPIQSTGVRAA